MTLSSYIFIPAWAFQVPLGYLTNVRSSSIVSVSRNSTEYTSLIQYFMFITPLYLVLVCATTPGRSIGWFLLGEKSTILSYPCIFFKLSTTWPPQLFLSIKAGGEPHCCSISNSLVVKLYGLILSLWYTATCLMLLKSVISKICATLAASPTPSAISTPTEYIFSSSGNSHTLYTPSSNTYSGSFLVSAILRCSSGSITLSPDSINSHPNSWSNICWLPNDLIVSSFHFMSLPGISCQSILAAAQLFLPLIALE